VELKPIRAKSVSEAIYEQLRDAILSGTLEAGRQLPGERKLCEMLEVNRGALREALKRLEQDQLVTVYQGEGTRVRDFRESARLDLLLRLMTTPAGTIDIAVASSVAQLRNILNPDIARLAAQWRGPEEIERLDHVLGEMQASLERMPTFQERVEGFWAVIAEASRNVAYRLLNNTMREIHIQSSHHLRPILGPEFTNMARYREIAAAIVAGDAAGARRITQVHVREISRSLKVDVPLDD